MTGRYTLRPKQKAGRLMDSIHETRIDSASRDAFRALAAAQGLSMRAALAQLLEQHAVIREPIRPIGKKPWGVEAIGERERYTATLPAFEVAPAVGLALLIDANRAGVRLTEAMRQLVWRCVQSGR